MAIFIPDISIYKAAEVAKISIDLSPLSRQKTGLLKITMQWRDHTVTV